MSAPVRSWSGARGAIFDLDEVILDRVPAWCYTVEQAMLSATGRRLDARPLADEYRHRPWRDALRVLETDVSLVSEAELLCQKMWERSALKRITVHEGIGMALAALLARRVIMGVVTSVPLPLARRQAQAAGVDRFLVLLQPTPEDGDDFATMATHLNIAPEEVAFISGDDSTLTAAERGGLRPFVARWASEGRGRFSEIRKATDLPQLAAEGSRGRS